METVSSGSSRGYRKKRSPMLDTIAALIRRRRRFLVTTHVRPDGDAIGSALAAYHVLRGLNKEAVVYLQDKIPDIYAFLPGASVVVRRLGAVDTFDAVILLDCSDITRVGDEADKVGSIGTVINIDHHLSNNGFAEYSLIDAGASSTGELLYRLIGELGVEITPDIAVNIYTAVVTDTGSFRYSSAGSAAFRLAAEMVDRGAEPHVVAERIYETAPRERIALLKSALNTLGFDYGGSVGSIVVTRAMLRKTKALSEHTEGLVDIVRSIEGVRVAVFYQEMEDGTVKVSLRSKGSTDVSRLAVRFGGGGHLNASACSIKGDVAEAKRQILDSIQALSIVAG